MNSGVATTPRLIALVGIVLIIGAALLVLRLSTSRVFSCDNHRTQGLLKDCWEWDDLSPELERWHQGLCQGEWGHGCPRRDALGGCTGGSGALQLWYYRNPEAQLFTPADVKKTLCDRNGSTFLSP
jgi:hypothetical protein